MKRLVALILTLVLCCTALTALSENITLKVWDGQDDQELLKELCEAYAAAHPENNYTFQYGVVGTADASARYLEDPAARRGAVQPAGTRFRKTSGNQTPPR